MELDGAGRYCESCEKHIVDLTDKSDAELIRFFKNKKENTCGRLLSGQLNRELVPPPSKAGWQWLLPLTMGAMVLTPAQASQLTPVTERSKQIDALPPVLAETPIKSSIPADTVKGSVLDSKSGAPLKGVRIRQKGFENVLAITDSNGRFELSTNKANLAITFNLNGYEQVELPVKNGMVVKLSVARTIMLGGISSVSLNQGPMYLIYSGKESCTVDAAKMKEIPPAWIEKMEVLKDAKATALYGAKAANGVILIGIKKEYAKKIDFSKKK